MAAAHDPPIVSATDIEASGVTDDAESDAGIAPVASSSSRSPSQQAVLNRKYRDAEDERLSP